MIPTKRILAVSAVLLLAALPSCNSKIDDPDGPDVFLEAENLTIPAVTTALDAGGGCVFTLTNATATFRNRPKNELAGEPPYPDITLLNLFVSYTWPVGYPPLGVREFGIGGTIPAGGSAPAQFHVIQPSEIGPYQGTVGQLLITFHGVTDAGSPVSYTTGGTIAIASCP